jgi:uncharacterized iron-regulated membrane protein
MHAWCGLVAGVGIFVINWTGTLAVFHEVIALWESPRYFEQERADAPHAFASIDATVRGVLERAYADDVVTGVSIRLPSSLDRSLTLTAFAEGAEPLNVAVDAVGSTSALPPAGLSQVITRLHTDLLMPSPLGPFLVGLAGVLGLLLIVSGILIHRHIIRDLFVVRLFRSQRLALHDIHALIETWVLPFHFLLSLSGAVLGFILFASFLVQRVAYGDDADRTLEAFEPPLFASDVAAETADLDAVLAAVADLERPFEPESLYVEHWGDQAARITVMGEPDDQLVWRRRTTFAGATGDLIDADLDAGNSALLTTYAAMTPIHYANFGGMLVRWLYFLLGLAVSFSIGASLVLWANKRATGHPLLPKLAVGICAGCIVATALLFPLDLVLRALPVDRYRYLEHALLAAWLSAVAMSLLYSSWPRMLTWLLHAGAALLAAGAVGSLLTALPRYWSGSSDVTLAGVDLGLMLVALAVHASARLALRIAPGDRAAPRIAADSA